MSVQWCDKCPSTRLTYASVLQRRVDQQGGTAMHFYILDLEATDLRFDRLLDLGTKAVENQ
jgi:hypothetical protein